MTAEIPAADAPQVSVARSTYRRCSRRWAVSEVVFGRVPPALKQALTTRAGERRLSLNATVCELLECALAVSAQEAAGEELEAALSASARELDETRARLAAAEGRLAAAAEQEEWTKGTLRALTERARPELGQCPACRKPVRGYDYLASGRCPHCGKALTALLTPLPQFGAPERDEYLALLGALGALVALAGASALDARGLGVSRSGGSATVLSAPFEATDRAAVVSCGSCDADGARETRPWSAAVRVRPLSPAPAAEVCRI